MTFEIVTKGVVALRAWEHPVSSGADAVGLIASARYETGCQGLIVPKEALSEDFFRLPTGLAGEVLQKFVNYQMKLAVVGDFSGYGSRNLADFIWESNRGHTVFFAATEAEGTERLAGEIS